MYTKKTLRYSAANDRHGRRNRITCFWSHKKTNIQKLHWKLSKVNRY
jgi:hypothetical protein